MKTIISIFMSLTFLLFYSSCNFKSDRTSNADSGFQGNQNDIEKSEISDDKQYETMNIITLLQVLDSQGKIIDAYTDLKKESSYCGGVSFNGDLIYYDYPNSGMHTTSDVEEISFDSFKLGIVLLFTGGEELQDDSRKIISKSRIIINKSDILKFLKSGEKYFRVLREFVVSSIDLGPLTTPWNGLFTVKDDILSLKILYDKENIIMATIKTGERVEIINISDRMFEVDGHNQYFLKIKYKDVEGWILEEYLDFR